MKAKQLRNALLQQAIEGRLVPQDPTDEPASVLLKRIHAEKQRLMKEGKLKKQKPLPPVTDKEKPFEIPKSWEWVRLGEIAVKITDGSHNPPPATLKGFPVISAKNIKNGKIVFSDSDRFTDGIGFLKENSRTEIIKGDIILGIIGASIGNTAVFDHDVKVIAQRSVAVINTLVNNLYCLLIFQSPFIQKKFKSETSGTAQGGVYLTQLNNLSVPVPPLAEQQRIVAKLGEILPEVDDYGNKQDELVKQENIFPDLLRKSLLQGAIEGRLVPQNADDEPASALVKRIHAEKTRLVKECKLKKQKPLPPITDEEKPFEIPESWVWVRLGEICNYGYSESINPDQFVDDIWILELEDIIKDTGKIIAKRKCKERKSMSSKNIFKKGDVLYSKLRPYLNKVITADEHGYCSSEILPLRFDKYVYPRYAQYSLMSPYFVEYATQCSYGVKMPRLGTDDGRMALFALPPLAEQQRIVAKLEELFPLCSNLGNHNK